MSIPDGPGTSHNTTPTDLSHCVSLLPLLGVAYMLQFLDKQTLNFSSIMGIIPDLVRFSQIDSVRFDSSRPQQHI